MKPEISEAEQLEINKHLQDLSVPERYAFIRGWEAKRAYNTKRSNGRKYRANAKQKDELMKSLGLTKVKGAVSGKTYWE